MLLKAFCVDGFSLTSADTQQVGALLPSSTNCRVLAFGQIRQAVVVTDDIGMHDLAKDFGITVWHGPELLAKMRTAKMVSNELIREIFEALEANGDQTGTWRDAKHTTREDESRLP